MKIVKHSIIVRIWRGIRASLLLGATALLAANAHPAEPQTLRGHLPAPVAAGLKPDGRLPASQELRLAIGLPLRNSDTLAALLRQLYDPASPVYHHFLNPEQFTAAFGPEEKDYQAVRLFAESHGLKVTGTHPNRMLLDVAGSVADVENAFHLHLGVYSHPTESRAFFAPDAEPTLDLDVPVLHIAGLSDFAISHPSSFHKQTATQSPNAAPSAGSAPYGSSYLYIGLDFRAAYVPGVTLNGAGQSVALVEFDTFHPTDVSEYLNSTYGGLANSSVAVIPVGVDEPTNTTPGTGSGEVALDIDMAISMAPGLAGVYVYEAPNSESAADDLFNRIATDNLARQISSSWSGVSDSTIHQDLVEFAAQGQSFFIASGDSGAYNTQNPVAPPVDDDYATSVGGTTLSTAGARQGWTSETTWNWYITDSPHTNSSSGGISPTVRIPTWQTNVSMAANNGSATWRNFPDVALTADQIYLIDNGGAGEVGGTSAAAPLWAGFMALVNQQNASVGNPPAGFLNPALYAISETTNYSACFHDITTGNDTNKVSPNQYFAVPGYDLCTGWGTPAGSNLINVLAAPLYVLEITPVSGFSDSAAVGGPIKPASQVFLLTNAGTAPLNWTLSSPAAWLSASPGGGALPAGGFTNVTVSLNTSGAAALPAGAYTNEVWITNLTQGVVQSRQFTLTLAAPQLVQNGGFETGDWTDWSGSATKANSNTSPNFVGNATSLATQGWHSTYVGSYYIHSGNNAAVMGESGDMAYLSQTLATVAGQAYLLSFWLDNPGEFSTSPAHKDFTAAWNGSVLFAQNNMADFSFTNMQFVVSATGTSTTLEFGFENDKDYFGFDDVSVVPVPAPAFQSAAIVTGSFTLTWAAVARVTYQLQYASTLSPPNWSNLGSPITATGATISTTDVQPSDPCRFYRVVVAP